MKSPKPQPPSFREAVLFWLKLGFISFGGPAGQIAIMHEFLVEKKRWISERKFLHALNYCMLLPGPEAQQLATYTGWLLHGTLGGLIAGLFFILPSMFILLGLATVYVSFGDIGWVSAMFSGLKPAVVAIVIYALIKIGKKSLAGWLHYTVAALAFVAIFYFNVPFPLIILAAVGVGLSATLWFPGIVGMTKHSENHNRIDENGYHVTTARVLPHTRFSPVKLVVQILCAFLLWILPIIGFRLWSADFEFWKQISLFFTKSAFITFGGAYAVLPYVAQETVDNLHWLSSIEMMDALALGETTPGPLIMVLVFVGYMAGYNMSGGLISMGALGLFTTTYYTFLPCFLFVLAGAPLIEKTQQNRTISDILNMVTAAVVGVILNLCVYLGIQVLITEPNTSIQINWWSALWVIVSLLLIYRTKVGMIGLILLSALFGFCLHLFGIQ